MTAGIYIRVSTNEQAQHGYSLGDQEESCSARARELGATEVIVFSDAGQSAGTLSRPSLTRLREALHTRSLDLVVVLDPDRLARNLSHQLLVTEEIEKAGARLEFLNFEWKNTSEGRLYYSMRGAIAEYEREKIRERVKRGIEAKARQGKLLAGNWYGYCRNPETREFEPDPKTAPIVQRLFELIGNELLSVNMTCKRLAEEGIPGPGGGIWYPQSMWRIVRNPVYCGVTYNFRGQWKHARHYRELEGHPGVIRVAVPAIVSKELWEEAQRSLDVVRPHARKHQGKQNPPFLLAGMIRCGQCGRRMSAYTTWNRGKRYRYYRCENGLSGRRFGDIAEPRCRPYEIAASRVDEAVWHSVLEILNNPDRIADAVRQDSFGAAAERDRLRQRVEFWEAKRARTLEAYTSGWMTKVEADETLARCSAELVESKRDLHKLEGLLRKEQSLRTRAHNVRTIGSEMLQTLDVADDLQRRKLVELLVEWVVFEGSAGQVRVVGRLDEEALGEGTASKTFVLVEAIG